MRKLRLGFLAIACVFVAVPALATLDVGTDLTLSITPDTPVAGGDTVSILVSDGNPGDFVALLIAQQEGELPLGELVLDIIPIAALSLGTFDADGEAGFDLVLPDSLPPGLSGQTLFGQAASVGFDRSSPPPTILWRESNVDSLTFQ